MCAEPLKKVFIRVRPGRPAPGFKAHGRIWQIEFFFCSYEFLLLEVDEERRTLVFEHEKTSLVSQADSGYLRMPTWWNKGPIMT